MNVAVNITHRVAVEHMKDAIREVEQEQLLRAARSHLESQRSRLVISSMLKNSLVILYGLQSS
jgi:formyltetrahydrofolate hydrolase